MRSSWFARLALCLALCLALLAGLLPALVLSAPTTVRAGLDGPGSGGPAPGCVAGSTNLVSNGSFEDPPFFAIDAPPQQQEPYSPAGWGSAAILWSNAQATGDSSRPSGAHYILIRAGTILSQTISTTGLQGATLSLSYTTYDGSLANRNPAFTLGGVTIPTTVTGTFDGAGSTTLPDDAPDSLTFAISSPSRISEVDAVVLTVTDCGIPDNTAPVFAPVPADRTVTIPSTATTATTGTTEWTVAATDEDSTATGQAVTVDCTATIDDVPDTVVTSGVTAFPIGETEVTCTAEDALPAGVIDPAPAAGRQTRFTITVEQNEPVTANPSDLDLETSVGQPVAGTVTLSEPVELDDTSLQVEPDDGGAIIALDAAGTGLTITYTPAAGFAGEDTFTVRVDDGLDTTDLVVTVAVSDDTAPILTVPATPIGVEATSSAGASVPFSVTATDDVDDADDLTIACTTDGQPAVSGDVFPIGTTTVSCTATDTAGNSSAAKTFTITVRDTTGPSGITWIGGPQRNATYAVGNVPAAPTCTATDLASPLLQCRVTGYSDQPGRHIMTARARDTAGNVTVETRTYSVVVDPAATSTPRPTTPAPTATPVTPQPTVPTVTPVPTQPPTAVPTRPVRTPVPTTAPAPTRPPRG
ncbi:MAG TPA: Ig-like domain-containing protein [Thermomicrobiales bacterium]|nr:Ig-like domain-containing protein [Thermomicrobiales bacterium]